MHERDVGIELCVHPSAQPTMGGGGGSGGDRVMQENVYQRTGWPQFETIARFQIAPEE